MKRVVIALLIAAACFGLGVGASSYDRDAIIASRLTTWAYTNRALSYCFPNDPVAHVAFEQRAQAFEQARELVLTHP